MATPHDISVFVPKENEEDYLLRNNITYKKLKNGVHILGVPRILQDTRTSSLQFAFSSGSYNDPKGKKGVHHLFEHLLVNQIQKNPKSVDIYKNAYTTYKEIVVDVEGTSNPQVKDFGLWPMLPTIINSLKSPIHDITDNQIENEVKIVLQEVAEKNTNINYHAYKFINECIFADNNPLRSDPLGNKEDLTSIKISDIKKIINNVFIPKNLFIRLFTEGSINIKNEVISEVEKEILDFPRGESTPTTVDLMLEECINQDFKPGNTYIKDNGLRNNLISVNFAWVFPAVDFTAHCLALNRFIPLIHNNILMYSRINGMGYSSFANSFGSLSSRTIILSLTLPNSFDPKRIKSEVFPGIKKGVIESIDKDVLKNLNEKEKLIQKAVPISTKDRMSLLQTGLEYYKRVIDADLVKKEYQKITLDDLNDWRNKLLEVEPATIISGDLG